MVKGKINETQKWTKSNNICTITHLLLQIINLFNCNKKFKRFLSLKSLKRLNGLKGYFFNQKAKRVCYSKGSLLVKVSLIVVSKGFLNSDTKKSKRFLNSDTKEYKKVP